MPREVTLNRLDRYPQDETAYPVPFPLDVSGMEVSDGDRQATAYLCDEIHRLGLTGHDTGKFIHDSVVSENQNRQLIKLAFNLVGLGDIAYNFYTQHVSRLPFDEHFEIFSEDCF